MLERRQAEAVAAQGSVGVTISSPVLCVDLDGTFLRTDTLYECLLAALKSRPSVLLRVPFWLLKGRCHLKQALTRAARDEVNLSVCPRAPEVVSLIDCARAAGKRVELVSAADHALLAGQDELRDVFDDVVGSTDGVNLKAQAKADLLRRRHPDGFAYIGNSRADLPVWRAAAERFGANLPHAVRRRAAAESLSLVELSKMRPIVPALVRSMRLHQWLKNLLIFVPLSLTLPQLALGELATFLAGFVLLGLLASGTYLLNDLLDVEADRRHPRKRLRPIASGELPLPVAAGASMLLIGTALLAAPLLSWSFTLVMAAYLALTVAYSFRLKQVAMVDVLVVASLFTLRIVAGIALVGHPPSHWLLMFSIFLFTSLALMKREVELNVMQRDGKKSVHGRDYAIDDRIFVLSFGVSSGVASLVIFALFISNVTQTGAHYATPPLLWGAMATVSYWLLHMWLQTTRGLMNDDPILYAARDRTSLALGGITFLFALAAQFVAL